MGQMHVELYSSKQQKKKGETEQIREKRGQLCQLSDICQAQSPWP